MRLLVTHIRGLVGAFDAPPAFLAGSDMRNFPVLEDAWLAVEDGQFVDFGPMSEFPGISDWRGVEVVDASGCYVLPSWCDSHCHPVFAEDRTGEFLDRLEGLTYAEIAARGGGILNSARALAALDVEELVRRAKERVEAAIRSGTGAMEMKSGYGLSVEAELRSMRAIWRLQEELPIPVTTTLLACHAVPEGYDAAGWTREAVDRLLPAVLAEGRVDAVDVFCEAGYFGLEETEEVLRAASRLKLRAKLHVNQFTAFGGVALCVKYGAASVDHLEILGEGDVEALQAGLATGSPTFPVALPGCSHFLGIPYTDGRRLIDAGLPLVLATDYNPGSHARSRCVGHSQNAAASPRGPLRCNFERCGGDGDIRPGRVHRARAAGRFHPDGSDAGARGAGVSVWRQPRSTSLPRRSGRTFGAWNASLSVSPTSARDVGRRSSRPLLQWSKPWKASGCWMSIPVAARTARS